MSEKITYYAMYLGGRTDEEPTGLVRRRELDGALADEGLRRDLTWGHTPLIVGWRRGDMTVELVEIGEDEATMLIQRFRERWGATQ
jgi:hypothetical protein